MSIRPLAVLLPAVLLASSAVAQVGPPVTPGFPNVPQTPGALLSGLNAPEQGRTAIIAYHGGVLFTVPEVPSSQPGADFQVRTWDISDPRDPQVTDVLGETPMPINAHGYFKSGEYLVIGSNWPPDAPWSFRYQAPGGLARTQYPDLMAAGVRGFLYPPWFVGETWWSYGEITGNAFIERDWTRLAEWDHLGMTGVIGHPILIGDLLIFASDQSRTGVATYDVSDPRNPVLLDVLTTGGPGGYWPEVWGGDGRLLVVWPYRTNGNGIRVVDATDPADLRFIADTPLPGDAAMYLQFQDDRAFVGDHVVDMRTFRSVLHLDAANVTRTHDGGTGIDTSQFALPLGNLLVTGGIGPNEGMAIWAHQAEPDTRGPTVGYHRPLAGQTGVSLEMPISLVIHETLETFTIVGGETFIVRPLGGDPLPGRLTFAFDDVLTFQPDADLLPDTTYEVVIPEGGIKDAAGNGIVGTSFTFSTGGMVGGNRPPVVTRLVADTWPAPPGTAVEFSADASDPDLDPLEYRFDFGDGSPRTPWASASVAAHSYTEPGHYQTGVQVRDPSGSIASGTTTVTVVTPPPAGARPVQSSPIVVDDLARRVWAVNPDNDSLTAIDADTLEVEVEVPTCDDPRSVALDRLRGELWVSCHDGDLLRIHAASDGSPVEDVITGTGSAPFGVVVADGGSEAHVALQGRGELVSFDTSSRAETGRVVLGPRPRAVAAAPDGRLLVTRFLSDEHHAEIWEVDPATHALSRNQRLLKFGDEAHRDTTASGKGVANQLGSLAISPDGSRAWFTANKPNDERGPLTGPDLDQDNTVRNLVASIDLGAGGLAGDVDLDNSDSASAVAYTPLGDYLFVALQGTDEVLVLDALRLDAASGLGAIVTRLAVGGAPQGVAFDPGTNRTFVKNLTGRSVTVLETDELFRTGARAVSSVDVPTVSAEAMDAQVLLGKRIFYAAGDPRMSSEGYLSCASCHLDGGHDGRTWDFTGRGEGLRNTTSLRGRSGTGHGNVHWSANFDEIQDFENDIRLAFGGSGFLAEDDWLATQDTLGGMKTGLSPELDALAAYVASLGADSVPRSPFRGPDGYLTPAGLGGRDVFQAEACASCHAGASFTDSELGSPLLHDVGTLRTTSGGRLGGPLTGIDTPTLLGVWNTAPYFHDGSAPTLADVFRIAGGALYPAEDGTVSDGASVTDQWVDLNNDSTVRGEAYVGLGGGRLTLTGVDGGAGGTGDLEIRHSFGWPSTLDVLVNGVSVRTGPLAPTANQPQWRQTVWEIERVADVPLTAGATNTIELVGDAGIDDVLVTTTDHRALARPHRRVLDLPAARQDELISYLLQVDGRPDEPGTEPLSPVVLLVAAADLSWTEVAAATGYDVVEGSLSALRASRGAFTASVTACLADDLAGTTLSHESSPPDRWFLVRAVAPGRVGPWDGESPTQLAPRAPGIEASAAACP